MLPTTNKQLIKNLYGIGRFCYVYVSFGYLSHAFVQCLIYLLEYSSAVCSNDKDQMEMCGPIAAWFWQTSSTYPNICEMFVQQEILKVQFGMQDGNTVALWNVPWNDSQND